MGNFSRDTYDYLKHYISVRLQQGVPLVDADWNEANDIRRFELQAFLKWYIGNGIPLGNDGFRIVPIFSLGNIGNINRQNLIEENIGLIRPYIENTEWNKFINILEAVDVSLPFIAPQRYSLRNNLSTWALSKNVIDNINIATPSFFIQKTINDFFIVGGDGSPSGAGRCLVEGWDVVIDNGLCYSEQLLYNNQELANRWNVEVLRDLSTPSERDRTDTVFLDIWEHEINSVEDSEIVNPALGIETCTRIKREWVVRVAQGYDIERFRNYESVLKDKLPLQYANHIFFPIAILERKKSVDVIDQDQIMDLRRKGLCLADFQDHDHSGNENGHKIESKGLANKAVTFEKLNFNIIASGTTGEIERPLENKPIEIVVKNVEDSIIRSRPIFPIAYLESTEGEMLMTKVEFWFKKKGIQNTSDICIFVSVKEENGSTEHYGRCIIRWYVYTFE